MSKIPIAIDCSDWHMQKCTWHRRPDLTGDAYFAFDQIIELANMYEVDIIAAGDLLDSHILTESETLWRIKLGCEELNGWIQFVQGQHEYQPRYPWLSLMPHCEHIHKTLFSIGDSSIGFYGLDWMMTEEIPEAFAAIPPDTDVLITHQVWTDFMGEHIGGACSFSQVPHVKCIMTGDFHSHLCTHSKGANGQDIQVISSGPPYMKTINEEDQKYCYLMYDDLSVVSIPIKGRKVYRFVLNKDTDVAAFLRKIDEIDPKPKDLPEELVKPIVNVKYDRSLPDVYKEIVRACNNNFHLFAEPLPHNLPEMEEADKTKHADTISKGLAGNLPQYHKPNTLEYKIARQLLSSTDDPPHVLEDLEGKQLK